MLKALVVKLHLELKEMAGGVERKKWALKEAIGHAFEVMLENNEWELTARLVESMPQRLQAVRRAGGYQTTF